MKCQLSNLFIEITLSNQLIKQNYLVILPTETTPQFWFCFSLDTSKWCNLLSQLLNSLQMCKFTNRSGSFLYNKTNYTAHALSVFHYVCYLCFAFIYLPHNSILQHPRKMADHLFSLLEDEFWKKGTKLDLKLYLTTWT